MSSPRTAASTSWSRPRGSSSGATAEDVADDTWRRVLDVNLNGTFWCARAAGRAMIDAGHGGRIVLIGSINSRIALGGQAAYCASKGGVAMLGAALAVDWARHGITVNTVGPGVVDTPMSARSLGDADRRGMLMGRTPLGRPADPADRGGRRLPRVPGGELSDGCLRARRWRLAGRLSDGPVRVDRVQTNARSRAHMKDKVLDVHVNLATGERSWESFATGDCYRTESITVTETHVVGWAGLTGDWVPLHVDAEYAATTDFGQRIAHGPLTLALALGLVTRTGIFGMSVLAWLGLDNVRLPRPVLLGDTITTEVVVQRDPADVEARSRAGGPRVRRPQPARRDGDDVHQHADPQDGPRDGGAGRVSEGS